ncbi:tyrosine-protein kinase HCK-like isoform X2 [Daphnia magna]|uniref:tyrosine-protein kinase HCK-like isoform X2 n=2 Tax=Daphnia magna TaxID=35525 RepID=UPI001E1BDB8B|nr:tyrosine-protein kinase HCK-like isoform X2 [Daphnia magna]
MAFQISTSSEKMTDAEQPKPAEDFFFKGKRLDCKNKIFGKGFFLFDGYWKENENAGAEKERGKSKTSNLKKEVAIRRIKNEDCLDGWKDVADKLVKGNLNHNNILRVFGYEEDVANGWRYFALEPYSATLYGYCNGWYNGPMPNESQVLYQITNGIFYLHGKRIVHGDLNPLNVVIAAQSRPVRMKISDFGLSKFSYSKQLSQKKKEGEKPFEMELCLRKYWTLSEETYSLEGIKDATEDVIATGCILFYYLKRGKHLFGNDFESILINLKEKNPVNLKKLDENHFAYEPIKNMINPPEKGFNWLQIANEEFKEALSLQVNTGKQLGKGYFGDVFEGKFNGDPVAVKQIKTTTAEKEIIQREMNTHIELNHVNVVKLLDVADSADNRFTHLVLELCGGTLTDYCQKKYSGPKLPPDELVLYQIANGLHYIHSRNLVHRDIKPENILISMTSPVQMKVSDLSFVKKTREDIFSQSKIRGTLQWMAPERIKVLIDTENKSAELPDGTIKSDTFSSGCVFFYFLTRGTHPFGKNQTTVPGNILENKQEEMLQAKFGGRRRKRKNPCWFD